MSLFEHHRSQRCFPYTQISTFITKVLQHHTILWITYVPLLTHGYGYECKPTNLATVCRFSFSSDLIKRKQNFDVIMDDTFIHSTAEEHMGDLMDLFKVLRKYGLKISPHKCQFFKKKIVYMGLEFQIQKDKVCYTPSKDKCDTIRT